ncbi:hypothetical protein BC941DRAFT_500183 [Chlamydoabsidia padenii]|nr:hypothetical protein BC941DRAFT_500183 [Chlamydoabsidia padenii]
MNPIFGYNEQQHYQYDQQNALIKDALNAEEAFFADYDHAMSREAGYFDHHQQGFSDHQLMTGGDDLDDRQDEQTLQQEEEEEDMMDSDDMVYDYQDDALLKLIVDVQSYISDLTNVGVDRHDSPLIGLQYKMYTYLKQRVNDMGMDADSLM